MLLHGDIRADNMFFDGDRLKVVDFQFAARGAGAADIGYLVSQGLPTRGAPRPRRGAGSRISRPACRAHGVTDYSFDEAWRHYRFAVAYLDGSSRHHADRLGAMPERSRALCLTLIERAVATIDDIDALEVFSMTRTAREVVELYNLVVWNERDFALADELMGDSVIRHEVGEAHTLTHEQAVQRIVDMWAMFDELRFDLNLVVAGDDGEHVAIVYESPMTLEGRHRDDDRQHGDLPCRRRQDHRSLELRLQARSLAVTDRVLDELGYYLLAGAGGEGPATLMDEARRGEELGFGTAFISERWNVKEASSLVGAACAVTNRMQIATAATNHNTRHPLITGSWATTMHRLSGRPLHARHRPRRGGHVRRVRGARR